MIPAWLKRVRCFSRFQFPSLTQKYDFKAHKGEIEDLDMSPGNKVRHLRLLGGFVKTLRR